MKYTSKLILNWETYQFGKEEMTKTITKLMLNWQEYEIREYQQWWWQPWANTIAYYPLTSTSTTNDLSWNGYNLTNSWATFSDNYCEINDSMFLFRNTSADANFISWSTDCTYSIWVKILWFNWNNNWYPYWQGEDSTARVWGLTMQSTSYWIDNWWYGEWVQVSMYNNYTDWHLITTVYDSTSQTKYLYLDWVLQTSKVQNVNISKDILYIWKDAIYGARLNAQISNFIIENKARTAQEISDYFNQTKWNYWIS